MKTKFHWKICIGFVVASLLSLGFSGIIYTMVLNTQQDIPTGVYVFMSIFGILGLWILLTLFLRAKRVEIKNGGLTISQLFYKSMHTYVATDIVHYEIIRRKENPFFVYYILQFQSKRGNIHSIVSYEFRHFNQISNWVINSKAPTSEIGMNKFIQQEYGPSFALALVLYVALLIPLAL